MKSFQIWEVYFFSEGGVLIFERIEFFWGGRGVVNLFLEVNPIRSGLFQTVNDPGGALKAPPPPPTISKTIVSIFTISYMWILPGVLGMIQLEFFKNSRF